VEIWAISPEPPDKLAQYAAKNGIGYTLLSDVDQAAITSWGIVNPQSPKVPHPTAVVVDGDGVVRYLRQDIDYRKRPPVPEILEAVDLID
jgi:peroxiredoxin